MGLGTKKQNGIYLSLAGGFIWNRKADSDDPDYAEQTYIKADKSEGVRTGAQYSDLTGMITGVMFRTHPEWGENINVTLEDEGEKFIVSISTNNRYSQDMMKFLLKADFSKPVYVKPYDFKDKAGKRVQGISFRQDGEKVNLRNDDAPQQESDWFKTASKKQIKRFFEDLTDWFVAEVEEKVCSQFSDEEKEAPKKEGAKKETTEEDVPTEAPDEAPKSEKESKVTPLRMKKFVKEYIAENYEDKTLPKLSREDLQKWYDLAKEDEELPFKEEASDNGDVSQDDLDSQLNALMK